MYFEQVKKIIIDCNCIEYGNYTYSNGDKGNLYIDLRKIFSYPRELNIICNFLIHNIKKRNLNYNAVVGIPTAGLVFSTLAASLLEKPLFYLRNKIKNHGIPSEIEGVFSKGDKVILIDDLVNTEQSKINAIEILQRYEIEVQAIFVILDRRNHQKRIKNIPVFSLLTKEILLKD